MIDINRNNYEEYFVDFLEGKLSPSDESLLMLFLNQNPDLKEELELYQEEPVLIGMDTFNNKTELKKQNILSALTSDNFDEICIACIENDLSEKDAIEFEKFIKENSERKKEVELYKLTKVIADNSIVFQSKHKLKRTTNKFVLRRNYTIISAAASIIIMIALYLFAPKQNKINRELPVAELSKKNITDKKLERSNIENRNVNNVTIKESEKSIINNKSENNIALTEQKQEVKSMDEEFGKREKTHLAYLNPIEVKLPIKNNTTRIQLVYKNIIAVEKEHSIDKNGLSFKAFLASTFNKRVLKTEDKTNIELFDIAHASIEGINKLTGSNMSLERLYDENGDPDKTEFNSKLLAFSTPIKKDQ
ncbi:hypothetical protein ACFLS4_00550 [Bacteroidota bacterium]